MDRRGFLTILAAGTAATLTGCGHPLTLRGVPASRAAVHPKGSTGNFLPPPATVVPSVAARPVAGVGALPRQTAGSAVPPPPGQVYPRMGATTIDHLPAGGPPRFALTVDDGVSTEVLEAYVDFVIATGMRMTFFVNGVYSSWTAVRRKLAPLVESGQVQLGNHTWNHPSITGLSSAQIVDQLTRNERFLTTTYGVSGRPYFRPPYGNHDKRTDLVTGELGFDRTVIWYGSLGDSAILTPAQVLANAREWFVARRIVIGHANHPAVTYTYRELFEVIRERNLQTVTLRDVFGDAPMGTAAGAVPGALGR